MWNSTLLSCTLKSQAVRKLNTSGSCWDKVVCRQMSKLVWSALFLAGFDWNIVSSTDIRHSRSLSNGIRTGNAVGHRPGVRMTHYLELDPFFCKVMSVSFESLAMKSEVY